MPKVKKTWQEKLRADSNFPCVEPMPPEMVRQYGEGTICLPSLLEVDEIK
jgi:hypothetical protein